jgi:hypothetical protein
MAADACYYSWTMGLCKLEAGPERKGEKETGE